MRSVKQFHCQILNDIENFKKMLAFSRLNEYNNRHREHHMTYKLIVVLSARRGERGATWILRF